MISVTALGIVGLASFHVNVRTQADRHASRGRCAPHRHHSLLHGGELAADDGRRRRWASLLAFAFGQWLSSAYSLPRLQPAYVAGGVVVLWILGQLAVVPAGALRRSAGDSAAHDARTRIAVIVEMSG